MAWNNNYITQIYMRRNYLSVVWSQRIPQIQQQIRQMLHYAPFFNRNVHTVRILLQKMVPCANVGYGTGALNNTGISQYILSYTCVISNHCAITCAIGISRNIFYAVLISGDTKQDPIGRSLDGIHVTWQIKGGMFYPRVLWETTGHFSKFYMLYIPHILFKILHGIYPIYGHDSCHGIRTRDLCTVSGRLTDYGSFFADTASLTPGVVPSPLAVI